MNAKKTIFSFWVDTRHFFENSFLGGLFRKKFISQQAIVFGSKIQAQQSIYQEARDEMLMYFTVWKSLIKCFFDHGIRWIRSANFAVFMIENLTRAKHYRGKVYFSEKNVFFLFSGVDEAIHAYYSMSPNEMFRPVSKHKQDRCTAKSFTFQFTYSSRSLFCNEIIWIHFEWLYLLASRKKMLSSVRKFHFSIVRLKSNLKLFSRI